jgi:hypothetical protein
MDLDPGTACRAHRSARHAAGFRNMKPVALCDNRHFGARYLHLRYGRSSAIPLASRSSLPPYVQSSVLARWLAFGHAGLSGWFTTAYLGALMVENPSEIVRLCGLGVLQPRRGDSDETLLLSHMLAGGRVAFQQRSRLGCRNGWGRPKNGTAGRSLVGMRVKGARWGTPGGRASRGGCKSA